MARFTDTDAVALAVGVRGLYDREKKREMAGIPLMIHGNPGLGKSAISEHVFDMLEIKPHVLELAKEQVETLTGFPIPYKRESGEWVYRRAPAEDFVDAVGSGNGFILNDYTAAVGAVQKGSLGWLLERKMGKLSFCDVPIVATANFDEATVTSQLNPAIANRVAHIMFEEGGDAKAFRESGGMSQLTLSVEKLKLLREMDPVTGDFTERSNKIWKEHYNRAQALVSQYTASTAKYTDEPPTAVEHPLHYAYATDRSYDMLTCMLAGALYMELDDVALNRVVSSCIGEGRATGMMAILEGRNIPSPADLYAGKVNWKTLRPSEAATLLYVVAKELSNASELQAFSDGLHDFMKAHGEEAGDMAVLPIRILQNRGRTTQTIAQTGAGGMKPVGTSLLAGLNKVKDEYAAKLGIEF